jgi:hypothetical protein
LQVPADRPADFMGLFRVFDFRPHLKPAAKIGVKPRIFRRCRHMLERTQMSIALEALVEFQILLDLSFTLVR